VAEPRAVERDYPVLSGCPIDQSADLEVLDHASIAVQQDERNAFAALDVVELDTVHLDQPASRRIVALCLSRQAMVHDSGGGKCHCRSGERQQVGGRSGGGAPNRERPRGAKQGHVGGFLLSA
jgi:hypothetical protein